MTSFAIVTYTTSKYSDVWPMHFGQLTKHATTIKSYVFSDEKSESQWQFENHNLICYSESDPYWKQYIECLSDVPEDFIIYSQEDFILYDDIDAQKIEDYVSFLRNSTYDYVRLIRCGFRTPLDRHVMNDIYEVDMSSKDAFSMQATLWKKSSIKKLYEYVKSEKWLESDDWNRGAFELGLRGTFIYNNEPKIGAFHYDSIVYPHICTAINKGKWNIDQYPLIMPTLLNDYNINPKVRGIRVR